MDEGAFSRIFSAASGVWAMAAMLAVALFKMGPHIMARLNERRRDSATEKSADWQRLRDEIGRLDGRCDHLQGEVDDCREREGEWMKRAIAAEAFQMGVGEANQKAAAIVAAERILDSKKNGGPTGGGK